MAESDRRKEAHVVTLSRDNYTRWRIELETALRGHGLWWHASGVEERVDEPGQMAAGGRAAEHAALVKSFREWDEKDSKARTVIIRTLDDVTFSHVADCTSSKSILERIAELRDPKTTDVLMTGITAFFSETWHETDDISSFMARLATHAGKVNSCKSEKSQISDQFIMAKTLTSLPESYAHFTQSWNLMAKSDTTLTLFREKILAAERNMVSSQPSASDAGDALQASGSRTQWRRGNKSGRTGQSNKTDTTCHNCGKKGHWKAECRNRVEDKRSKGKADTGDGSACAATRLQISLSAFAASSPDSIIADSGASRHMTGNRFWFRSLKRLDKPETFLAASGEIQAHHCGDIDVETSVDGKKWTRRTWENVLYIPALSASLYSHDGQRGQRIRVLAQAETNDDNKKRETVYRRSQGWVVTQTLHSGREAGGNRFCSSND